MLGAGILFRAPRWAGQPEQGVRGVAEKRLCFLDALQVCCGCGGEEAGFGEGSLPLVT